MPLKGVSETALIPTSVGQEAIQASRRETIRKRPTPLPTQWTTGDGLSRGSESTAATETNYWYANAQGFATVHPSAR